MHCTMGKDEYDKSQGGFLPPFSPEHVGNHVSVPQDNPVSCGPPSDCKSQLVLNARQLPNEQRFDSCNKRISSNGGLYRRKPLDSDLPKSCPSDLSFETVGNPSEKTLRGDLASIGPGDASDSEDHGFTTHRPNVNGFFEPVTDTTAHDFRPGHRQGRKERNVSSFHKRKTDNFAMFREEEAWKSHHPPTATNNSMSRKGNSRPWPENPKYSSLQMSPPQRPNNFVQMQGDYALDDGSIPYHPPRHLQNYEQYVVPPNFAYTADDIYRNAFSVGSYPNLIASKKVGHDMFSFVNALVSPPFFTPYQQPELAPPQCQYYAAAVNPQDVRHRQSAQQAPREETYTTNNTVVQPQTPIRLAGFSSSYDDRLHRHHLGGGGDYSDQSLQVVAQENWLQNGINSASEEAFNSSLGSGISCSNGKTIFRSRSLSAVEQSSREAEHSLQADNYLSSMSSSSHHSNYSIAHVENALHNLSFGHSKSNARYPYPNGSVPPPAANGNLQISREGLLTNNAHPNDSLVCGDHLQPAMSRHQDLAWSAPFSCAPERTVFAQPEFYEDDTGFLADTTDDVFWQSAAEVNYLHSLSSSSSSCPRLSFPTMSHKSVSYHDSKSQSFSQDENYLSFGANKVGSSSDTEIYLKSTQSGPVHNLQSNCEYEDVAAPDAAGTTQAVFVMDEEIFNSPDTNFQLPVPPLKLTNSSELNSHQFVRLNEMEPQDPPPPISREQDGLVRPQGTRYTCAKGGPKKVRRKSGGGATPEVNQPMMNPNCQSNNLDFRPVGGGVPVYRRHWEKSSTLWASYNCKDLNTFSSLSCPQPNKNKCKDFDSKHIANSPSSEQWKEQRKIGPLCGGGGGHARNSKKKNYPKKSQRFQAPRCLKPEGTPDSEKQTPLREDHEDPCVPAGSRLSVDVCESKLIKPQNNDVYPWHHLPDEIWLNIFSYLGNHYRFQCSLLSKQFHRILQDESLWRHITLEKKMLQDDWLLRIAHLHPSTLELIQCHGDQVTAAGLSYLFKECTDSLLKLRFSRCSRGELTGDNILFASTVCRNLTHVDASWCTVTDSGLLAIAKSCDRLESLCLNGCGLIADNGLKTLATLHCKSLKELEMFGCFNITSHGIRYLASICRSLRTLQLGQCYKITDSCIAEVSSSLCCVENLDLRGCKQIKDTCIEKIVDNCSRLQTLALANCPNISNNAMQKIASTLPGIRSIDVCGCKRITDESVNRLAMNCRQLVYLDISSTGCTYKSVCRLAEQGSTDLETLKLNFITGITESSLTLLTKHCKSLTTLHLYGCKRVKNLEKLQALHPQLIIESDKD